MNKLDMYDAVNIFLCKEDLLLFKMSWVLIHVNEFTFTI